MKKHWSVDEKALSSDPRAHAIWRLEQRINWGIGDEHIDTNELRTYWNDIDIDPAKRRALELALQA
ncbi:MAG: hypothetical protein AAB908_02155 [Patescibacteria group bacterium]